MFTDVLRAQQITNFHTIFSTAINPGNFSMFPWLSNIALNFEMYRFRRLSFEYVPCCPTTSFGNLIVAVDYDAADAAPTELKAMSTYQDCGSSSVWAPATFPQRAVSRQGPRYIRVGNLSANLDIKTYDLGNLFIAVQSAAPSQDLGYMRVHYEVELLIPQVRPGGVILASSASLSSADFASVNKPLGTKPSILGGLPFTYDSVTGQLKIERAGDYIVNVDAIGSGITNLLLNTGTGATALTDDDYPIISASGQTAAGEWLVTVAAGAVFSLAAVASSFIGANVRISPYVKSLWV